jgi:hypothetical protein
MGSLLCRSVNLGAISKLEQIAGQENSDVGFASPPSGIEQEQAVGGLDKPLTKRGRKPEDWSRTTDIYMALIVWEHAPDPGRMSLRELAGKIGTSHQLLSYYHKRLSSWSPRGGSPYDRVAVHLEREAERETDPLRRLEMKKLARFCRQQANSMAAKYTFECITERLSKKIAAGKPLSKKEARTAEICGRFGHRVLHPK